MKYWLSGALSLLIASSAWAQDYRVVSSPSLKLDIWIDNIKSNAPSSWCASELPLRIVANGEKNPSVMNTFLPRVGSLLANQCAKLSVIHWQMNDSTGKSLAKGSALKAHRWAVQVDPAATASATSGGTAASATQAATAGGAAGNASQAVTTGGAATAPTNTHPGSTTPATQTPEAPAAPPVVAAEDLSPPADTTPWVQFSLMDGCHFRTWWRSGQTSALFVPAKGGVTCGSDGWLSGASEISQSGRGGPRTLHMTFLQGFPVAGLNAKALGRDLQITTVNNERMVLSDEKSPQSWMLVPWAPELNGWKVNGTVAVQITRSEADDDSALKARLNEVRKVWSPYLSNGGSLTIRLVTALHPQLKDPAAGAFRTLN
ncbi:hypothetical protein AAGR22_03555 [Erwinia sp. HDF1-3R]|uniref:hypothetical protein n=1 Tax=Erwinia sp. HDF1-3R TaxID=3141543 RepID=UPI0031F4C8A4